MIGVSEHLAGGRYRVERRIGHGGMATVVLALDDQLGRPVAIKILADNLAGDPQVRQRFLREARIAGGLVHPNVIRVYDAGEERGRPYFVMEYVAGSTLAETLRDRGPLPWEDVVEIGVQVCAGLEHAHAAGIVHRDVKPQNLLRDAAGNVKVTDFGIAQTIEGTALTATGTVLGTLPYLAPERLRDGRQASGASDVYAVGVLLYELLTGRPPYPSDSISDLLAAQAAGKPPPIAERVPGVPPRLEGAILDCLVEDPAARPRSAGALGGELAGATQRPLGHHAPVETGVRAVAVTAPIAPPVDRSPDPPAPPGASRRAPPGRRRRIPRLRTVLAAVVALLLAGGIATATVMLASNREEPERPRVQRIPPPDPVSRTEDPANQFRALARWIEERTRDPRDRRRRSR